MAPEEPGHPGFKSLPAEGDNPTSKNIPGQPVLATSGTKDGAWGFRRGSFPGFPLPKVGRKPAPESDKIAGTASPGSDGGWWLWVIILAVFTIAVLIVLA